ncbi:MAG TPA: VWA domain-containing protein [Pyrinomonadaceae bacterium]|nr:VWA domain-containing protein [Pyrinomonadaceae bacterium]
MSFRNTLLSTARGLSGALLILILAESTLTQQPTQQRPRRVSKDAASQQTNQTTNGEEVDEGDVLRVETQLVSVPAVVTNRNGRPIANLKLQNFRVFEDGKPQMLTNLGTAQAPFEIALLLDTSGSTRADVALIRQAANSFIEALRPGDRVAVVAFNTRDQGNIKAAVVDLLSPLTHDREQLKTAIENVGSSNGTPFYEALKLVAKEVFAAAPRYEVRGRRAIVALTDGVDSTSETDFASARSALIAKDIACYFVQVNTEDFVEDRLLKDCQDDGRLSLSAKQLERYRTIFIKGATPDFLADFCQMGPFERMQISRDLYNLARREMDALAKTSGGRNFVARTLRDARAAFAMVANEIGMQYSLGYYPTNKTRDGKFRVIRVEVQGTPEPAQVRAREGYYAPKG